MAATTPTREPDTLLVRRAAAGDAASFEELVRRYEGRLYRTVLGVMRDATEAEDVTQDAFVKAWTALPRYRGESGFFTWLYRIGLNEAFQRMRRKRLPTVPLGPIDQLDTGFSREVADWSDNPEAVAMSGELRRTIDAAIAALPPDYRAALLLRDVEGASNEEAAATVGLSVAAFKSRLHRARMSVRERIDGYLSGRGAETNGDATRDA